MIERKVYLLNKKAYEKITKQSAEELYKTRALKQYLLTEKELFGINPQNTNDTEKPKIFTFNKEGITRIYFEGSTKITSTNSYLKNTWMI